MGAYLCDLRVRIHMIPASYWHAYGTEVLECYVITMLWVEVHLNLANLFAISLEKRSEESAHLMIRGQVAKGQ